MHCFSLSVPEISAPPASISLKVLLSRKETERGAANTTARCAGHKFASSTRYIGHRIPAARFRARRTRYYRVTRSNLYLARPHRASTVAGRRASFFSPRFLLPIGPAALRRYPRLPPLSRPPTHVPRMPFARAR